MAPRLKLSGVVLPDGERRELWVVDGLIRTEPVGDAEAVPGGWLMPGLVDAHCHVGLEMHGAVPDDVAEQHALSERSAGALLLRDAGSPADTRWMDERDDLPKIIRAGRHIARPCAICATTAPRSSRPNWSPRSSGRPRAATAGSSWSGTGSTARSVIFLRCGRPTWPRRRSPGPTNWVAG